MGWNGPSALYGAKMMYPLLARAAPLNFADIEMVSEMSRSRKLPSLGSYKPTAAELYGAKTTSPLFATAAPANWCSEVVLASCSSEMSVKRKVWA